MEIVTRSGHSMKLKVWYEDRRRRMNPCPGPRWTAYVEVFGWTVVGEGDTRRNAVQEALRSLPAYLARHFA